MMRV
jgi:hypothetical protein